MARGKKQSLSAEEFLEQALVPEDEQPYEVPKNWSWVKFGHLAIDIADGPFGSNLKKEHYTDSKEVRIIQLSNIGESGWRENNTKYTTFEHAESISRSLVKPGEIVIAKMMPAGRAIIVPNDEKAYVLSSDAVKFVPKNSINTKYLLYGINSNTFRNQITSETQGITRARTSIGKLRTYAFPLPPIPEQQRIVDRIESLFAKLDQAKELAQNAIDSFETRKAAILHKAFTGELTTKWREEQTTQPAPNRLMDIIKTQSNTGSKNKELVAYIAELVIDDVLDSNGWLHLKAMLLCDNITCGGTPTGFIYENEEIPFLKVYNIVDNKIAFAEKPQFTNRVIHEGQLKSSKLKPDDVVMNIVGPPLRKIAIIPEDYAEWNMNQAIVRFRVLEHLLPKYLYYCLVYPATLDDVVSDTKGMVGQANISVTQSRNLNIPVPSLEEQHEIVNILDSFFDKEQKAKELSDVVDKLDIIKKAILARAFRGELGTNDPSEVSAFELLKQVVATL